MTKEIRLLTHPSRESQYLNIIPQIRELIGDESDTIANMANVSAVLKEAFNFLWVGFYIVKRDVLVLGPFQGHIACTRIKLGKGVCGSSWEQKRTIVVPDVNTFAGHIACSSEARSEIVVPLLHNDQVVAVLDIDSESENHFTEIDTKYLQQIVEFVVEVSFRGL